MLKNNTSADYPTTNLFNYYSKPFMFVIYTTQKVGSRMVMVINSAIIETEYATLTISRIF